MHLFKEVVDEIATKYVLPVDAQEAINSALRQAFLKGRQDLHADVRREEVMLTLLKNMDVDYPSFSSLGDKAKLIQQLREWADLIIENGKTRSATEGGANVVG